MSKDIWNAEEAMVVEVSMFFCKKKKQPPTIYINIILILTFTHDTGELSCNVAV